MALGSVLEQEDQAATAEAPVVASLHQVTKRFGQQTALNQLSLELRRGEVVALLGPNGAGKTTAVRLLLGLSQANLGGREHLWGRSPGTAPAACV